MWRKPVSKYKNAQAMEQAGQSVKFGQAGLPASTECPELVACAHGLLLATCAGRLCLWRLLADLQPALRPVTGVSGALSDLQLSPFNADAPLGAAVTADGRLALFSVSPSPSAAPVGDEVTLRSTLDCTQDGDVFKRLQFSPSANHLVAVASPSRLTFVDVEVGRSIFSVDVNLDNAIHSIAWTSDSGQLAASSGHAVRLWDPRAPAAPGASWRAPGLSAGQPSRAHCLARPGGGPPLIALSGLDSAGRERRLCLWDLRASDAAACESLGRAGRRGGEAARLLADSHTGMLFWAAPGDESLTYAELEGPDNKLGFAIRDRFLLPADEQLNDLALVDKFSLDVGACEVNRVAIVTSKSVRLVSYRVPRKTVSSFHADLFPDCPGRQPAMSPADWLAGRVAQAPLESLDPTARARVAACPAVKSDAAAMDQPASDAAMTAASTTASTATTATLPLPSPHVGDLNGLERATKLRNVATAIGQRGTWLTELRPLLKLDLPPEAEPLAATDRWLALPVAGPGGRVLALPARLAATTGGRVDSLPGRRLLRHEGAGVNALAFEPFDSQQKQQRLAVALDTGAVVVWRLPDPDEQQDQGETDWNAGSDAGDDVVNADSEPRYRRLRGHLVRALLLAWHPRASDILASVAADGEVRIWNLGDVGANAVLASTAPSPAVAACWSQCGRRLLLLGRDGRLHALSFTNGEGFWSSSPGSVAGLKQPLRAGRLASVLRSGAALVSGFAANNASARRLALVRLSDADCDVDAEAKGDVWAQVGECVDFTDGGTAPLSLAADTDLLLVTCWSRGDRTLAHLTVGWDCGVAPLLGSDYRDSRALVGAAWLTKRACDVARIEVARGFRLTAEGTLETVGVTVPRVCDQLFQDDLLSRCSVTWQPSCSAADWLTDPTAGGPLNWPVVSLQPGGMQSVSQAAADPRLRQQQQQQQQKSSAPVRKFEALQLDLEQQQQQKEAELVSAMLANVQADTGPLPQDLMEGADSDEWSDD